MIPYIPLDIETIPELPEADAKKLIAETIQHPASMSKQETIDDWHAGRGKYEGAKDALIDDKWRKTSFDGARGSICSIAWVFDDEPFSLVAVPGERSEADLLREFYDVIARQRDGRQQLPAAHYAEFDLPFIYKRSVVNNVYPSFPIAAFGRHERDYFCTMRAWAGFKDNIGLDDLCRALGIDIPSPEGVSGAVVWDLYREGKYDVIEQYNRADALKVNAIIKRLTFVG